jgi:tetratricopeptide (TPR) repeat protein
VWLLHGIAELYRAKGDINGALKMYEDAKKASQEVFNINRVAHANLGICEVNRMKRQINMNDFTRPLQIYKEIGSEWGVASIYISQSLSCISQNKEREKVKELLTRAENICQKLNLSEELKLISRIREGSRDELHPLSFF